MKQNLTLIHSSVSADQHKPVRSKAVPKTSAGVEDSIPIRPNGNVGIAKLARYFGISKSGIYDLIKSDPSFPFKNVGVKKKYVINVDEYERWLANRTTKEKETTFKIPTGVDLLKRFKK
jgi:predicted DNA-binding transcriptional regulator AlpA